MQHHVLVVPRELPPGLAEQVGAGDAVLAQAVDQPVVGPDHGHVHLGDQHVRVLTRVAGQGDAFLVTGQVVLLARSARAQQDPGRIGPAVEVRIADRPLAVQELQIQPRAAGVPEQLRVVVVRQRRAVGREVVGQVLAEHRPGPCGRRTGRRP